MLYGLREDRVSNARIARGIPGQFTTTNNQCGLQPILTFLNVLSMKVLQNTGALEDQVHLDNRRASTAATAVNYLRKFIGNP